MRINAGDTAWVLTSAALVLFMTPGLALFYGGMVRAKNVLAMLMQNFFCIGLVSVLWAVCMYSLAFQRHRQVDRQLRPRVPRRREHDPGDRLRRGADPAAVVLGVPDDVRGHHARADHRRDRRPHEVLGVGLVRRAVGALVYTPVAHWVFSPAGWLFRRGALDFAGGTVVHINAGHRRARRGARDRPPARVAEAPDRRRTRCRSRCSAPASCGSAGSASTPVPRSPPTASPRRRS